MKNFQYIPLFILTILLSLNAFSQTIEISFTNKYGEYIHEGKNTTIYIDTMRVTSYKILVDDVKPYVFSDSIELRINSPHYKPIVKKYSINNKRIEIKLERKEFIKTIVNEKVILQKAPQVIIASFLNDSSLCRELERYNYFYSYKDREGAMGGYKGYYLDTSIVQLQQDPIFKQFYAPKCTIQWPAVTSWCMRSGQYTLNNVEITNKEVEVRFFFVGKVRESAAWDLYYRCDASLLGHASRLFFDKVPYYFLAKDSLKYLKIYPQILLEPKGKIKKKEVVKLLNWGQSIKIDSNKYIIELNGTMVYGFEYWINYFYSTNLFSSVQLITEPFNPKKIKK